MRGRFYSRAGTERALRALWIWAARIFGTPRALFRGGRSAGIRGDIGINCCRRFGLLKL